MKLFNNKFFIVALCVAVVLCAVFAVCFATDPFSMSGMTALVEYDPTAQVYENGMFSYVQTVELEARTCMQQGQNEKALQLLLQGF